jgi:multiple sugar transport system substrate-binding protein
MNDAGMGDQRKLAEAHVRKPRNPAALARTFLILLLLLLTACKSGSLETPREATALAQAALPPTREPTPVISSAPTATPGGTTPAEPEAAVPKSGPVAELTFWATISDGNELEVLQEGLTDFADATGIQVEIVQVAPRLLPGLMQTAVISGTMPDLVLHPVEYTHGWQKRGILDAEAATDVLERLGEETFEPAALGEVRIDAASESVAALPSTGWKQLILYRTDWFDRLGLSAPDTFRNLATAAEMIHEEDSPISGLIVPTDSSLVSTQQVFEHMAVANGCRLVSEGGEVLLLHPACLQALEYYRALINANSPIGLQTDISALNGYLSGRTGIIIASPAVLPIIAGLDEETRPSCPDCDTADFLATNTGIVTTLSGDGEYAQAANFSAVTALGITSTADTEASKAFAAYWFETLYPDWVTVNPEQKAPMRRGTQEDVAIFKTSWFEAPLAGGTVTLAEVYGPEAAALLGQQIAPFERWGLAQHQGALLSSLYEELLLAPLLQDMLSGYFSSSETIVEMYLMAVDAIPVYEFPIQVAPSPTPE